MANNSALIEAYKSYYATAKEEYNAGNMAEARELFLKTAEVANEISIKTDNMKIRMEYHDAAQKLIDFARNKCVRKEQLKKAIGEGEGSGVTTFTPMDKKSKITFKEVAGLQEVKDQITYHVIEPMLHPELAARYNIKAGAKILMYGPPGTGKTYIAKAIAGEVDAAFYAVNCQDLISKYMGESSQKLNELFEEARKNERAIIFFDEFDSVAGKRSDATSGADAESARFVASFLTLVDGFKESETNKMLLLIAATNRPWALDSAMIRGGRFDTHVYVGLPDQEARIFMVKKAMKGAPLAQGVTVEKIADALEGYGGGDIVAICDKICFETYQRAVRLKQEVPITTDDCNAVLKQVRKVTTKADLAKFAAFKEGREIN